MAGTVTAAYEEIGKLFWFDVGTPRAVKIGVDTNLFSHLNNAEPAGASTEQLSSLTGVEARLLRRILRVLAVDSWVLETGPGSFAPTDITKVLGDVKFQSLVRSVCEMDLPAALASPAFLKNSRYKDPTDSSCTPWNNAHSTQLKYFDYLNQPDREHQRDDFINQLQAKNQVTRQWYQSLNAPQVLGQATSNAPLLIDIGGNDGNELVSLLNQHPTLAGGLLLQDLPGPISKAEIPDRIAAQAYDFFTPQPVHGAKNYYMHRILHDWPDDQCREILRNQKAAMKPGYSKILINEIVIPDQGATWLEAGIDMIMLAKHASTERTESEWRDLVDSAALKIVEILGSREDLDKILVVDIS